MKGWRIAIVMKNRLLILCLFSIFGCTARMETQSSTASDTSATDTRLGQIAAGSIDTVLYRMEALHNFSSIVDKDTFKITVYGKSLNDGKFRFQIVARSGKPILDETYETTRLLDYSLKANATDIEIEDHIKARIDKFFNEDNFNQPAISRDATFDEDYSEREIWDDLVADQTAVGYYYLIGEEDIRRIAFSKKLGKVVMYYNCC
jgi:hypothetical protein